MKIIRPPPEAKPAKTQCKQCYAVLEIEKIDCTLNISQSEYRFQCPCCSTYGGVDLDSFDVKPLEYVW